MKIKSFIILVVGVVAFTKIVCAQDPQNNNDYQINIIPVDNLKIKINVFYGTDQVRKDLFATLPSPILKKEIKNENADERTQYVKVEYEQNSSFQKLPFVRFSLCPYIYDDLGKLNEDVACQLIGDGGYYSLHSLDAGFRQTAEVNLWISRVGKPLVTIAVGLLLSEAIVVYSGLKILSTPTIMGSLTKQSLTSKAAYYGSLYFFIPIPVLTLSNMSYDALAGSENLKETFDRYQFLKPAYWRDDSALLINGSIQDFATMLDQMLASGWKEHPEICEGCMIHCQTRSYESDVSIGMVGGLSPSTRYNHSDFYDCE